MVRSSVHKDTSRLLMPSLARKIFRFHLAPVLRIAHDDISQDGSQDMGAVHLFVIQKKTHLMVERALVQLLTVGLFADLHLEMVGGTNPRASRHLPLFLFQI